MALSKIFYFLYFFEHDENFITFFEFSGEKYLKKETQKYTIYIFFYLNFICTVLLFELNFKYVFGYSWCSIIWSFQLGFCFMNCWTFFKEFGKFLRKTMKTWRKFVKICGKAPEKPPTNTHFFKPPNTNCSNTSLIYSRKENLLPCNTLIKEFSRFPQFYFSCPNLSPPPLPLKTKLLLSKPRLWNSFHHSKNSKLDGKTLRKLAN